LENIFQPLGIQPLGIGQAVLEAGHMLQTKGQGSPLLLDRPLPTGTLALCLG